MSKLFFNSSGLLCVDNWWRQSLPVLILSQGYLTAPQLCQVMEWKLKRGKFRPLMGLVQSNKNETVEAATRKAFQLVALAVKNGKGINEKELIVAIRTLSDPLKGVGPATASAVC